MQDRDLIIPATVLLGSLAGNILLNRNLNKNSTPKDDIISTEDIIEEVRKFIKDFNPKIVTDQPYPYYSPSQNLLSIPKGIHDAIKAHEVGHAINSHPKYRKKMWDRLDYLGRLLSNVRLFTPAVSSAAGQYIALEEEMGNKPNILVRYSPEILTTLLKMPIIREEYLASKRGNKLIKDITKARGIDPSHYKKGKSMTKKALGTYITAGLQEIAAANLTKNIARRAK